MSDLRPVETASVSVCVNSVTRFRSVVSRATRVLIPAGQTSSRSESLSVVQKHRKRMLGGGGGAFDGSRPALHSEQAGIRHDSSGCQRPTEPYPGTGHPFNKVPPRERTKMATILQLTSSLFQALLIARRPSSTTEETGGRQRCLMCVCELDRASEARGNAVMHALMMWP